MLADLASLEGEENGKTLKVMAGFGLTCFALRDPDLADQPLSFAQLQSLSTSQFKPHWSNVWNGRSDRVCNLVDDLESLIRDRQVKSRFQLAVYVGTCGTSSHDDVIVKYNYNDGSRQWDPVPAERLQRRVTRALYDIAVENGTSTRIRAYSRDDWKGHDMIPHLDVWMPPNGSPFDTVVTPRRSFPSISFIRHVLIKRKCGVVSHGLRFTLNYLDKFSTRINIQCRPLSQTDTEAAIPSLSDSMQDLLGKMLAITQ